MGTVSGVQSSGATASRLPRLSVIVPATDEPPTLERCRGAIESQLDPTDELIVVTEAPRPGPASARNAGAAAAAEEVLVFVDADVIVRHGAMARIRDALGFSEGLAAVFGSYDDSPEAPGPVSGFRNLLHHHVHQSSPGPAATFWAGLGAVRREVFNRVGGFDERTYSEPSIEDIELGMRLRAAGAQIVLDPGLQCTHLKHWTLGEMVRTDVMRRGAPWVALLAAAAGNGVRPRASRAPPRALNLGWRHRVSAAATLGLLTSLLARRPTAASAFALALVALNQSFYGLLLRRRGAREAVAGVGLHAVHHLSAVISVPLGLARHRNAPRAEAAIHDQRMATEGR